MPWDDGTGEKLYVIGQFATAGGLTDANSFAAWDGESWSGVGAGFTQAVARVTYDMLAADLGDGERLYLAGNWAEIGGETASGLAWFDGTQFGAWGTGDGIGIWGGFSPFVSALQLWDDGSGPAVYACGRFLGIDNASTRDVARYNVSTGAWESFGLPLAPTSTVNNMTSWAIFDDGTGEALYIGGQGFRVSGDPNIYLVAKWNGAEWKGVGQTLSGRVTDLEVWDDGSGPALYLSGTATFEVNYFAKLVNDKWIPAQSGVNNPPVTGNFASAFGLYVWNNKLLVGGNFTQVGGFDPVTGAGQGTPLPARGLAALESCIVEVAIDSFEFTRGNYSSGTVADLASSDNSDVSGRRNSSDTVSRVFLEVKGVSPTETPSSLKFTLEASVFARSTVVQSIDLFNYDTATWEEVDSQPAAAFVDSTVMVSATGDLSRFVEDGTNCIEARCRYESPSARQQFTANVDQVLWTIGL